MCCSDSRGQVTGLPNTPHSNPPGFGEIKHGRKFDALTCARPSKQDEGGLHFHTSSSRWWVWVGSNGCGAWTRHCPSRTLTTQHFLSLCMGVWVRVRDGMPCTNCAWNGAHIFQQCCSHWFLESTTERFWLRHGWMQSSRIVEAVWTGSWMSVETEVGTPPPLTLDPLELCVYPRVTRSHPEWSFYAPWWWWWLRLFTPTDTSHVTHL